MTEQPTRERVTPGMRYTTELETAEIAARKAGEIIKKSYSALKPSDVSEKRLNDMVTVVDLESQEAVVSIIRERFPNDFIIAEENLDPKVNKGIDRATSRRWYIDPLDGTTNYIHAFPMFAVNIALEEPGDEGMVVGVTLDPMRDEFFYAVRGHGAYLNGERIHVSRISEKNRTLFLTGFPFRSREYLDDYLKTFKFFFNNAREIRRAGSAALDLAYVAAGRADAFWELTLSPWDMAAGIILIRKRAGVSPTSSARTTRLRTGMSSRRTDNSMTGCARRSRRCSQRAATTRMSRWAATNGAAGSIMCPPAEEIPNGTEHVKTPSDLQGPKGFSACAPYRSPKSDQRRSLQSLAQTPRKNPPWHSSFRFHSPLRRPWTLRSRPIHPPANHPAPRSSPLPQ